MKYTAMQQAILEVRKRIDSQNETLIGKHTAHHLQQVERELHLLLKDEKEQMYESYNEGFVYFPSIEYFNEYYKETYGKNA